MQLREPWIDGTEPSKQPRYLQNRSCILWSVFNGKNDWHIINVIPDPTCDPELLELSKEVVLESVAENCKIELRRGNYAVVDFDDEKRRREYQLALVTSDPYYPSDDPDPYQPWEKEKQPLDPNLMYISIKYMDPVPSLKQWYFVGQKTPREKVLVQQILMPDIELQERVVGGSPDFPPRTRKTVKNNEQYTRSVFFPAEMEMAVLDEVQRRKRLDYFIAADVDDDIDANFISEDGGDDLIVVEEE